MAKQPTPLRPVDLVDAIDREADEILSVTEMLHVVFSNLAEPRSNGELASAMDGFAVLANWIGRRVGQMKDDADQLYEITSQPERSTGGAR